VTTDIVELASQYGRYGYRRVTALLNAGGIEVGKDRVQRIGRREGLKVSKKQPKRSRRWLNDGSCIRLRHAYPNHVWSLSDNGPEMVAKVLRRWLKGLGSKSLYIEPGSHWENGSPGTKSRSGHLS
jgi:hypothetical protein